MRTCLIGLGANLGDRREQLQRAISSLQQHADVQVDGVSRFRETSPVGGPPGQPCYLNACARLRTDLSPQVLLARLHELERRAGRQRDERWGARSLDLDLLLFDDLIIHQPQLWLPHPRMAFRRFVLEPAAEIAGDLRHPEIGWTVARLAAHLDATPRYVALAGPPDSGKTQLAKQLVTHFDGQLWSRETPANAERRLVSSHPGPRVEAPSRPLEVELEFFRQRTQLLTDVAAGPTTAEPRWHISDFWWEQGWLYAQRTLSATDLATYKEHWFTVRPTVPRPRLLVITGPTVRSGSPPSDSEDDNLVWDLAQHIPLVDQGPMLRTTGLDPRSAEAEIAAAMEAMQ